MDWKMILDKFEHEMKNHKFHGSIIAQHTSLQGEHTYYLASEVNIFLEQLKPYFEFIEIIKKYEYDLIDWDCIAALNLSDNVNEIKSQIKSLENK